MPAHSILYLLHGGPSKASSRARGFWIAEELTKNGIRCQLQCCRLKREMLRAAAEIPRHDVIVFQKTYTRWHVALLRWANYLGKQTYFDIDDHPSPNGVARTLRNFEHMLRRCDGVLAGSEALRDYIQPFQPNVHLVPTGIRLTDYPLKATSETPSNGVVCLGWTGNANTYAPDLISVLREPLTVVARKTPLRLKIVGACGRPELYRNFGQIRGLQLDCIDTLDWGNPVDVAEALKDFDIGLFPLLRNEYNHYKCGFKALEYMAMGIPVISSPVAINTAIVQHEKNGLLADTKHEWIGALRMLIEDPAKRRSMGLAGRAIVENNYDVKMIASGVVKILTEGCEYRATHNQWITS